MPASEIEKLYTNHWEDRGKIIDKGSELSRQLYGKAHDIRICLTTRTMQLSINTTGTKI